MAKKAKTVKSQSDIHNVDPPDDDDDIETGELNEDEKARDEKVRDYQEAAQEKAEGKAPAPSGEQKAGEPVPPPAGSPTPPAETTVTIRADGTVESGTTPPPATEK
jgi:hypothetical protein